MEDNRGQLLLYQTVFVRTRWNKKLLADSNGFQ